MRKGAPAHTTTPTHEGDLTTDHSAIVKTVREIFVCDRASATLKALFRSRFKLRRMFTVIPVKEHVGIIYLMLNMTGRSRKTTK